MTTDAPGTREDLDFDVIVVGARPAGASLAAHLGARGARVLLVDRATHPSAPGVPSCPAIYPGAMRLLDELGVREADYADDGARMRRFVVETPWFDARFRMPEIAGRDYACGVDRAQLDAAIFAAATRHASVTAWQGVAVDDLLRDGDGRVVGVEGRARGGAPVRARARFTVGADGRYSLVARKAGAAIVEERTGCESTTYFADWEGVLPYAGERGPVGHVYATARGVDVLLLPKTRGLTMVATHERADRVHVEGDAERHYLDVCGSLPGVARRLAGARRVGRVLGMKKVANRYLTHGGRGWALVGDALHQKDPVDGQGIYDALVEAKVLAEALGRVLAGSSGEEEGLAFYRRRLYEETHAMFEATVERLRKELYAEPPVPVIRTLMRWMLTDPVYQDRFLRLLGREIDPAGWLSPSLIAGSVVRGIGRDLRGLFRRRGAPA